MTIRSFLRGARLVSAAGLVLLGFTNSGCSCDRDDGGSTSEVGMFEGLFDDVATGFNFPFDLGIVPPEAAAVDGAMAGDIVVASYGTSQIMHVRDPGGGSPSAETFYEGPDDSLLGAMAVSIPPDGTIWAAFEQGGEGDMGGIVALSPLGERLTLLDGTADAAAFAHPGGLCWGGLEADGVRMQFFLVNMGDGTAWRISTADSAGTDAQFTRVGTGLAAGTTGNPGTPGSGITTSSDLPQGGARGCAYHQGSLYVADAQNARVVRFDGVDSGRDLAPATLDDTPSNLVTYPTGVAINEEGILIVISYDNAHAFVALETPMGAFYDNGLHDLNVNSGNYGLAVAHDTIWFTRANNQNGALRAVTPKQDVPPVTEGPFPAQ